MIDTGRKAATAIRDARTRAGLTQEKAAALQGHATSTISRWENGGLPQTWDELGRYAHALGQAIVLSFGPDTAIEPPPEERLDVKLDIALWALNVSLEEQADLLVRRARGEAWPPRSTDDEPPAGGAQSANAPQGPGTRRGQ